MSDITDEDRLRWLAGSVDGEPIIEGFANDLDDFYMYLGEEMAKRFPDDDVPVDIVETPDERLAAFRAMIDYQIEHERRNTPWST